MSWHWYLGALILGLGAPIPEDTCRECASRFRKAGIIVLCIIAAAGALILAL
jgi:hypothetical protein